MKIRTGIMGVSGYIARELIKILRNHPSLEISRLFSRTPGMLISRVHKEIKDEIRTELFHPSALKELDLVFLCLPSGESQRRALPFLKEGKRVVDLSADFRFRDKAVYEKAYQKHEHPELLKKAVYGLPEFNRKKIKRAQLVANPGCYSTAVLLGCLPLVKEGLIEDSIIVDAKSGVSGAGRKSEERYLYVSIADNFFPYKVFEHRHQPEIAEQISEIAGRKTGVLFVPQILPLKQGILAAIYCRLKKKTDFEEIKAVFEKYYSKEKFAAFQVELPELSQVRDTNRAVISARISGKTLVVFTVLDNLIKGASGQAIQNANIMCGLKEDEGLVS